MSVRTYGILIVDDDRTSARILDHRLRKLGFTNIDLARDGVEALRHVISKHYDLVFLDNNMPNMSGLDFLRRCKSVSILDGTSVIMLTGIADGETVRCVKEEELKLDDFMVKPMDPDVLEAKIRRLESGAASSVEWLSGSRNAETGAFLSIALNRTEDVSVLKLFGFFHQDDKHTVKDIPDRVCLAPTEAVIIDMRDVLSIDEFGIGMLLLINGVACMARKLTYLLLDTKTIRPRLEALGISKVMRVIEHESEAAPVALAVAAA